MNDVDLAWGDSHFYDAYYRYGRPRRSEGAGR